MGYLLYLPKEKALKHRAVAFCLAVLGNVAMTTAVIPGIHLPFYCAVFTVLSLLLVISILQYNHWCIPRVCEQISSLLRKVLYGTIH